MQKRLWVFNRFWYTKKGVLVEQDKKVRGTANFPSLKNLERELKRKGPKEGMEYSEKEYPIFIPHDKEQTIHYLTTLMHDVQEFPFALGIFGIENAQRLNELMKKISQKKIYRVGITRIGNEGIVVPKESPYVLGIQAKTKHERRFNCSSKPEIRERDVQFYILHEKDMWKDSFKGYALGILEKTK